LSLRLYTYARVPRVEEGWSSSPLSHEGYIGERRTTFVKGYEIEKRCYWEHLGDNFENMWNKLGMR